MAGAGIRIDVQDEEVRGALRSLVRAVKDLRPAFDEIGARVETSTQRRFETETDPDGEPWEPSGASYERGGSGVHPQGGGHVDRGQTLTDTGRLRASITRLVSEQAVVVGTNVVYAAIHQFGGKTPPRTVRPRTKKALFWPGAKHPVKSVQHPGSKIPARAFLGVSGSDARAIVGIINRRLREAWA